LLEKKRIYKPKKISGFPELLPEYRAVELEWLDKIRKVFESYGFCSIETPSVEAVEALLAKGGDTEKEIYTLSRLHEDETSSKKDARLALHFDLTVPTARYVAQHFNELIFPFKRYQIQRVWRGERSQKGRYREFCQADIDIINIDDLPIHFDAELPAVMFEAYQALDIPPVELRISNRKVICGYLEGLAIKDIPAVTRILDKIDKIGKEKAIKMLIDEVGISNELAKKSTAITAINSYDKSFVKKIKSLGVENETINKGIEELLFVVENLSHLPEGAFKIDLSIIRGLDYYTGTILEVYLKDSDFGAIGGGGRYDNLAGAFINQKLPGMGVTIGVTRLFHKLLDDGFIQPKSQSTAQILVVLPNEEKRGLAIETANILRKRGYRVELYHSTTKIKKQLSYAQRKKIPYVWFPPFSDGQEHEVKNMNSGEQVNAIPEKWEA